VARNQHLAKFQGNMELWAGEHQRKVEFLENKVREAQGEIKKLAV